MKQLSNTQIVKIFGSKTVRVSRKYNWDQLKGQGVYRMYPGKDYTSLNGLRSSIHIQNKKHGTKMHVRTWQGNTYVVTE